VLQNPVAFLRLIALIEAVSTLILFGIAMPLKYVWDMPLAVRIAGSIHGGLFLVFCYALLRVLQQTDWPLRRAALVFFASVVPVAPFLLDGRMKAWAAAFRRAA
jgi:integral membrane protein